MDDKNGDSLELQTLLGSNEQNQNTDGGKQRESPPLNGKSALKVIYTQWSVKNSQPVTDYSHLKSRK